MHCCIGGEGGGGVCSDTSAVIANWHLIQPFFLHIYSYIHTTATCSSYIRPVTLNTMLPLFLQDLLRSNSLHNDLMSRVEDSTDLMSGLHSSTRMSNQRRAATGSFSHSDTMQANCEGISSLVR